MPTEESPAFVSYTVTVAGLGLVTVEAHRGATYEVRLPSGVVHGYTSQTGTPSEALAAGEIAYAVANPPAFPINEETIYESYLAAGYLDPITGIKLKTTRSAQSKFGDMLTGLSLAEKFDQADANTEFTIFDYSDAGFSVTVAQFEGLMLRYFFFCKSLFDLYAP